MLCFWLPLALMVAVITGMIVNSHTAVVRLLLLAVLVG